MVAHRSSVRKFTWMHASHGAGRATVAGTCVTVLKAFFEMSDFEPDTDTPQLGTPLSDPGYIEKFADKLFTPRKFAQHFRGMNERLFAPPGSENVGAHDMLRSTVTDPGVTLAGELGKLAANVAIARNMASVHYYTDHFDSMRMRERVAVGILQERMPNYPEPVTMRLTNFDDDKIVICGDGTGGGNVLILENGKPVDGAHWWKRHAPDPEQS